MNILTHVVVFIFFTANALGQVKTTDPNIGDGSMSHPHLIQFNFKDKTFIERDFNSFKKGSWVQLKITNVNPYIYRVSVQEKDSITLNNAIPPFISSLFSTDNLAKIVTNLGSLVVTPTLLATNESILEMDVNNVDNFIMQDPVTNPASSFDLMGSWERLKGKNSDWQLASQAKNIDLFFASCTNNPGWIPPQAKKQAETSWKELMKSLPLPKNTSNETMKAKNKISVCTVNEIDKALFDIKNEITYQVIDIEQIRLSIFKKINTINNIVRSKTIWHLESPEITLESNIINDPNLVDKEFSPFIDRFVVSEKKFQESYNLYLNKISNCGDLIEKNTRLKKADSVISTYQTTQQKILIDFSTGLFIKADSLKNQLLNLSKSEFTFTSMPMQLNQPVTPLSFSLTPLLDKPNLPTLYLNMTADLSLALVLVFL